MGMIVEMGMVLGPKERVYIEAPEEQAARIQFEASHDFKVGDTVYLSAKGIAYMGDRLGPVYADIKGTVAETKTRPEGGPMIRVNFGGNHINIWHPNEDLIRIDTATEALYGK